MKALKSLQEKARVLRTRGISINAIAKQLAVAKSSVSLWTSEIKLSKKHKRSLILKSINAGRIAFTKAAHKRSQDYEIRTLQQQKLGVQDTNSLSVLDIQMLGLGLYWGEGYKRGSRELGFTNSDPQANKFFIRWLVSIFGAEKRRLSLRVSVNALHRQRENEIISYWCKTLGVQPSQFTKTSFVTAKQKRNYAGRGKHYGTLRIKLRGGSTLRARILSSIDIIEKNI